MARSDLLRKLFASYARSDDAGFRAVARELIADERRKRHDRLAADLEQALEADLRPGAAVPLTLRPIPKGRDERPLLRLVKPARHFEDLVLDGRTSETLTRVVEEHLHRGELACNGLRPRQRLLFVGPSGTGKSVSAHAIAAELSLPVAIASLSALTSSFLGETARNIESVVRFAERTPCVLVFDEFDTLAQERGERGDHGEVRRVVATVLQLLEDLAGESIAVATSNHPALLDAAIWRRFDEVVPFAPLLPEAIASLLRLKLRATRSEVSWQRWAEALAGCSPAEVELVCLDAMRDAVLRRTDVVTDDALGEAVRRMGERKDAVSHYLQTGVR